MVTRILLGAGLLTLGIFCIAAYAAMGYEPDWFFVMGMGFVFLGYLLPWFKELK